MKHSIKVYRRYFTYLQRRGTQPAVKQKALMGEHQCLNCGMTYVGNFCPCCGQTASTARFTIKQTLNHLLFFFTKFDDKFKHTVVSLLYRPGYMIREYITGHRVNYMRPIQMLVCLVTVYAILSYFLLPAHEPAKLLGAINNATDGGLATAVANNPFLSTCHKLIEKGMNNTVVRTLSFVVMLTFASKLVFCRNSIGRQFNLAEHFYVFVFVACLNKIIDFILLPLDVLEKNLEGHSFLYFLLLWFVICQLYQVGKRKGFYYAFMVGFVAVVEIFLLVVVLVMILAMTGVINIMD